MKKEELLALEEIYENSLQTKKEMEEELQKCLNRKEEIEVFLTSIKESQDFDEKIFSQMDKPNHIQLILFLLLY